MDTEYVRDLGSSLYIQNPYRISFANSIIIGKSLLTECNRSTIHVFKSSHVVNDIDIKSHLATSLLGSSKRSKILLRGNWMLSCNPGVWTFG